MPKKDSKPAAKKIMTAEDLSKVNWQDLLTKLPQFANLVAQIIGLFGNKSAPKTATAGGTEGLPCSQDVKDANDADLKALAHYVASRLQLSDAICCCEPDDGDEDE